MYIVGIVKTIHAVDLTVVFLEAVVFQFIAYIDQDKKKTCNPDGQTHYVQKGIVEILQNISDCDGKKMAEHEAESIDEYGINTSTKPLPSHLKY
jgi:hypothetical protein